MAGNVIGVNTAIFSPSGGSVGIAFDIPSDTVKSVVAQLKDKGMVSRGWIGVQIQPITAEIAEGLGMKASEGALVAEPQAGSPAAKAGIDSGDVITAVNGHAVKDARDLARQIGAMAPGSDAKLSVWRKGEEKSFTLTLGELPRERDARAASVPDGSPTGTDVPKLGLMLAPAGQVGASNTEGVVVTEVDPNGIASEHGFKAGDIILDVAGKKVTKPEDVRTAIADAHRDGKHTRADAGEVGGRDQVCRRSPRPRLRRVGSSRTRVGRVSKPSRPGRLGGVTRRPCWGQARRLSPSCDQVWLLCVGEITRIAAAADPEWRL